MNDPSNLDPIEVPGNELIPGYTYYIVGKSFRPKSLDPDYLDPLHPMIGQYVCEALRNDYMFNQIYGCAVQFYSSSRYSFYTCISYQMKDRYRMIRKPSPEISFREDLISYVWEPSRVERFWITDDYEIFDMMA